MKDGTQDIGPPRRCFRYAVFALAALLVVSLGFAVIPRGPETPAAPPFSEQSRAAAFADTLALRAAGISLSGAAATSGQEQQAAALSRVVTLLTVQARALMVPADGEGSPVPDGPMLPPTVEELAAGLQASGARRLKDAETADGGMARVLAGAGTAQLLAAESLASAAGTALATPPGAAFPGGTRPQAMERPSTAASGEACTFAPDSASGSASADLGPALASAMEAELELVYAYQAALTRLDPASAGPASDFLAQHGDLRDAAAALGRSRCASVPPRQPGYVLSREFLAAPGPALGRLEADALPVYGVLVALSDGSGRAWALSALQSAARRAAHWGASTGPVPGVAVDEAMLPTLPEPAAIAVPSTGAPSTGRP